MYTLLAIFFIIFANSLDSDQDLQDIRPTEYGSWSGSKPFDSLILFPIDFFRKKSAEDNKIVKNYPACKELTLYSKQAPLDTFFKILWKMEIAPEEQMLYFPYYFQNYWNVKIIFWKYLKIWIIYRKWFNDLNIACGVKS